jgi:thiamine pyrophosphate-dependent acetolactate synthase large subunit-like protein
MSQKENSIGRYLVELLSMNGIDTVFGIPGVHTLELYRPLAESALRHILVRHEQGAGFSADGYARMSGRPAAAFVISGPGLSNILTAAGQAYSDSVPMIVIASTPARESLAKEWGVLHELRNQRALAQAVFGFARSAWSAEDVRDHLRAAFTALRSGRARPAYLEIPLDLLGESTRLRAERFPDGSAAPPGVNLHAAIELLEKSQRPLIIAGGGARAAGASIRELLDKLDGYLATTTAGKGILPESHPGNLGASLPYQPTQERVAEADVIMAVGTEISETDVYSAMRLPMRGKLIRIDIDPIKLSDHYQAEVPVHGDANRVLAEIASAVSRRRGWRSSAGSAADHRVKVNATFDAASQARLAALLAIRAALPADGAVFSDMTQIAYLGNYAFGVDKPSLWHHPSGYGTLGYALPAAIGAKIAHADRAIVALAGDFGLMFTLSELMTAVEAQICLPVILWNNAALGQIRDDMAAADITAVGVAARNPDFGALAGSFGAGYTLVRNADELTCALRQALTAAGPTLIEARESDFALKP